MPPASRPARSRSAACFCFCGGSIGADILRRLVAIDFVEFAERLAGVGLAPELAQRDAHIHQTVRRARAARAILVIIVKGDRGEAGLAFVEVGAAEQILRKARIAALWPFLDDRLQLCLRLGIEFGVPQAIAIIIAILRLVAGRGRSEEHKSELQSLMRISYAVFCLNKNNIPTINL